jgi:PAS domain S-box-containing protein
MNIPFENTEHRDHDEHTVLIIDDEPANLRVMSDYLSSFGLEALVARDGETGIEKAQYAQPDLILLDVLMPGIDGFETCRRLKANEVLRDIPVLFMTALTETQDKVKGFDVGGVDYITKPFQVEEVLARVKTHLVLHTMQKQLEAQNAQLQQEMARRWQAESQREAVLEALRESEELHRLTLASISDAVFLTDDTGVFTFICPNVHIIFGYSVQEVRALGNITRLVGEGLFVPAKLEALGEIENIERDITDKAGDVHSLLVSVKRVSIRGGTRLYACRDITERKRAEEALQEAHDELEQRVVERTAELAQANIKLKEEITERKRAESHREAALEALRGSEQRYHSLFEDMPLALWEENYFQVKAYLENLLASGVTDLRAYFENHPEAAADCAGLVQVLDVNKAAVALVGGRDKEQLLARLPEGFTATSLQAFGEQLVTLAEGGREFESEATYRKLTGEEQVVLLHLSVAPGHESSLGRVLVSMLDVTERRQAEKALQESEERYRTLFEGVPIGLYRTTPAGQILDANPALVHMLGYPDRESLLAADVIDLYVNPQDRQQWQALAKKEGGVHDFEVQLRRHDGRTIWVWDSARAVYDAEGQTLYYEGSQEDVTERKRAEEALRASEQKFRNVVEQSQDGILLTDEQGQVMEWNRRQEQITGLDRAEVLGQPLWDIQFRMVPEERRTPAIYTGFELNSLELLQGGHPSWLDQLLETTIQLPDGRQRIIQSVVFPIKTDKRVMIGSINRDITEQKKAEEALRRRVTQLVLINEIGGRIAAEFELDGVLDAAARLVQESFGYSRVALFTVDHTRKEAVMKARSGSYNPLLPPDYRLKLGRGMVGWVAAHGEKLLANHVAAEPRYINAYPELIPTQSELSVPIRVGEQIVGVLDAQSPELDAFDENDVLVMETVAGQIAVAIEDARLYEAIQRELTERRRAEEALRLERDLAVTLSSTSDLREALNELLEIGLEVEGIDCGGAYLVDALTGALDQVVHSGSLTSGRSHPRPV